MCCLIELVYWIFGCEEHVYEVIDADLMELKEKEDACC